MQRHIAPQLQKVSPGWLLLLFCDWWGSSFIILVRSCGWKCLFWCSAVVREVSDLSRGARYFLLLLERGFCLMCAKSLTFWAQISLLVFLRRSSAATFFTYYAIRSTSWSYISATCAGGVFWDGWLQGTVGPQFMWASCECKPGFSRESWGRHCML